METAFSWYGFIRDNGILTALGKKISIATPLYTYVLAISTILGSYIPKIIAIKLFSITADLLNAFYIYKIVRLKYLTGRIPFWAAGAFLILPTVFVNSAFWGQYDACYTVFLVASLYFFLKEKPIWGMLAFSFAFAFKLQAVFYVPFLVILLFKRRTKWWHYLLVPIVYILICIPLVVLGRSWLDVLTIYLGQADFYHALSLNAPNLYIFFPDTYSQVGIYIGLLIATVGICSWIILSIRNKIVLDQKMLVLIALISVAITPFLLPEMHERYFYPADVFSLITAFFIPELWFLPLTYQVISGLSYTVFMLHASVNNVVIAASINTAGVVFLLRRQFKEKRILVPK